MLSLAARRIASGSLVVSAARSDAAALIFSIVAWVGSRPRLSSSSSSTGQFGRSQLGPGSRSIIPMASFILRCDQQLLQRLAELRWAWGYDDSSRFHGRDLACRIALAAGDDRSGLAHAAARRRGPARDKADEGLATATLRCVGEELRSVFFGASADLADHDDRLRLVVAKEHLEDVDELGALHRVASNAHRGRLAETLVRGLEHGFVGQRPGAADNA